MPTAISVRTSARVASSSACLSRLSHDLRTAEAAAARAARSPKVNAQKRQLAARMEALRAAKAAKRIDDAASIETGVDGEEDGSA
jgi:hypothetical protein